MVPHLGMLLRQPQVPCPELRDMSLLKSIQGAAQRRLLGKPWPLPSRSQSLLTVATPFMSQAAGKDPHCFLSYGCVLVQRLNDHFYGHWRFTDMPHIIIRDVRHGRVTDLCFAGQKCFR